MHISASAAGRSEVVRRISDLGRRFVRSQVGLESCLIPDTDTQTHLFPRVSRVAGSVSCSPSKSLKLDKYIFYQGRIWIKPKQTR